MAAAAVAASLVALLAANGSVVLDCVCNHVSQDFHQYGYGGNWIYHAYCKMFDEFRVLFLCEDALLMDRVPSIFVDLLPQSRPWDSQCDYALESLRQLTDASPVDQLTGDLMCSIAADCIQSYSLQGLNETEWNVKTLESENVRKPLLSQLLEVIHRITKAIKARRLCAEHRQWKFLQGPLNETEFQAEVSPYLKHLSSYMRDAKQFLRLGVKHLLQLLLPLAFEHRKFYSEVNNITTWIAGMQHMKEMLQTHFLGWILDIESVVNQIANYKVEEDKKIPGKYIVRLPLLNHRLLSFHEQYKFFREDFSACCEEKHPNAASMFTVADALYTFSHNVWFEEILKVLPYYNNGDSSGLKPLSRHIEIVVEEWQLEDRSHAMLSVDTGCLQLLANQLDHPNCPLEGMPADTNKQLLDCRKLLWRDLVLQTPSVPINSYLSYINRANVNLCLLAWMAVNSNGICQNVPFSMSRSVQDARCIFDYADERSCVKCSEADAFCSVSRAILLLKCRDFPPVASGEKFCDAVTSRSPFLQTLSRQTIRERNNLIQNYNFSLSPATLPYRKIKIVRLKNLEIAFIVVNIFFHILTAGVYMTVPHLRNLPGKIFLSYQLTGIVQILFSEVSYRMKGVPDLSMAAQIDNALTLLGCMWLNSFCYQMYSCVRHFWLPSDLEPAEASKRFSRHVMFALIPTSIQCATSVGLESVSKYYLPHSRIICITAISLSVAFNLICLGMIAYTYFYNLIRMRRLNISRDHKLGTKRQLIYLPFTIVFVSGIATIVKIGFLQAQQHTAQYMYYVDIATMVQGPLLFVFFICNEKTICALKSRAISYWTPNVISPWHELCSSAERNLARRNNLQTPYEIL